MLDPSKALRDEDLNVGTDKLYLEDKYGWVGRDQTFTWLKFEDESLLRECLEIEDSNTSSSSW